MSRLLSNTILNALPEAYLQTFREKLKHVPLPVGKVLYEPHQTPHFAHFLTSGIASIVTTMTDGGCAETGLWGNEGLVECFHLSGSTRVPNQCFMQVGGTALQMLYTELRDQVLAVEVLRNAVARNMQTQALILGQLAACNRLHEVEERLARWLLMLQDRLQEDTLLITQEFLADMLGSRRTTVTMAAGALQRIGLIEYQRGRVHILDRERLVSAACECYPIIHKLTFEADSRTPVPTHDGVA